MEMWREVGQQTGTAALQRTEIGENMEHLWRFFTHYRQSTSTSQTEQPPFAQRPSTIGAEGYRRTSERINMQRAGHAGCMFTLKSAYCRIKGSGCPKNCKGGNIFFTARNKNSKAWNENFKAGNFHGAPCRGNFTHKTRRKSRENFPFITISCQDTLLKSDKAANMPTRKTCS